MERIVALCRRRGFIFGSSEIYGGIGGFWDYGPLGTELKRNIKDVWWHDMVINPPIGPDGKEVSMVGLDCSIIMNPKVWEASGHVGGFQDPMVACKAEGCKRLFRADKVFALKLRLINASDSDETIRRLRDFHGTHLGRSGGPRVIDERKEGTQYLSVQADTLTDAKELASTAVKDFAKKNNIKALKSFHLHMQDGAPAGNLVLGVDASHREYMCEFDSLNARPFNVQTPCPVCGGDLAEPKLFNLMFESHAGAIKDEGSKVYLRPETAQGIFVNYKNVMDSTRVKIPFGIAQIGKAFRNEINPRNYTFRSREFEQMEIEFFCPPKESRMWYEFWRDVRLKWYESLGIKSEKLRPREQGEDELAHYSDACTDVEYLFPFSDEPQELEGIAHRGDFDLKAHGVGSKNKENTFAVLDDDTRERYVPHVIEPSAGVDRFLLATLCEAYTVDESRPSPEFLKFHPRLAPIKAAVFPLVKKDGMPEVAEEIYRDIKPHYICQFDIKQSIGKRYARMDEAGTPYCFTVDGQTLEDGTVTVRDRDTGQQERIDKSKCLEYLREKLHL